MTKKIQAKNSMGQLIELDEEEIVRIATSLGWVPGKKGEHSEMSVHQRNEHYHNKALSAITEGAEHLGVHDIEDNEVEMKKLLTILFKSGASAELKSEIMYEIIERAISCHWKKIHADY